MIISLPLLLFYYRFLFYFIVLSILVVHPTSTSQVPLLLNIPPLSPGPYSERLSQRRKGCVDHKFERGDIFFHIRKTERPLRDCEKSSSRGARWALALRKGAEFRGVGLSNAKKATWSGHESCSAGLESKTTRERKSERKKKEGAYPPSIYGDCISRHARDG